MLTPYDACRANWSDGKKLAQHLFVAMRDGFCTALPYFRKGKPEGPPLKRDTGDELINDFRGLTYLRADG